MKTYCSKCGSANEYSIAKPKFCGNCASPFEMFAPAAVANPTSVNKRKPTPKAVVTEDNDDDGDSLNYFDANSIKKLDVNVMVPHTIGTKKLEDLLSSPAAPRARQYVRGNEPDMVKFMAEIQKAAGAGGSNRKTE